MNPDREEYTAVKENIILLTQEQDDTEYNLDEFLVLNMRNGNGRAAGNMQQLDVGNSMVEVQGKGGHSVLHIENSNTQNIKPAKKPDINLFFCANCRNCYQNSGTMKLHERSCFRESTKGPLPVHECKQCRKVYVSAINLKIHMQTHSGNKAFRCGRCYRKFFDERLYKAHVDRHIRQDELDAEAYALRAQYPDKHFVVKEFNCVFCKQNFTAVCDVGRVRHRFTCDACVQKYNSAEATRQGQKRELYCNRCGRKYVFQAFLERHKPNCNGTLKPKRKTKTLTT